MPTTVGVMPREGWGEAAEVREFESAAIAHEFVMGVYDRYDMGEYEYVTQIGMAEGTFRRTYRLPREAETEGAG